MTILKEYHPVVRAIQIGNLDQACAAVNEGRDGATEFHAWHNCRDLFIAHKDGSFETASGGDWLVSILYDGRLIALSDHAFTSSYTELAHKIAS
jgi:hypothetical protein